MNLIFFGLILMMIGYLLLREALFAFRRNIKVGDVIGVDFGAEKVLNRTVVKVDHEAGTVLVMSDTSTQHEKLVDMYQCFMPDRYSPIDIIPEE